MKYLPTLDIHNRAIGSAIESGQIKLQIGQWLTCGVNNDHKCRFVGFCGACIWVTHWQGNSRATNLKFLASIKSNIKRLNRSKN